jgi:hypothetical protein
MAIRNIFLEAWSALTATGLTALVVMLMIAPFVFSLIANMGRPVPRAARIRVPRRRMTRAVRTLPS